MIWIVVGLLASAGTTAWLFRPLSEVEQRLVGTWYRLPFANMLIVLAPNHRYTIHFGSLDEAGNRFLTSRTESGSWQAAEGSLMLQESRTSLTRLKMLWQGDNLSIEYRLQFFGEDRVRLDRGAFYNDWTRCTPAPALSPAKTPPGSPLQEDPQDGSPAM